MITTENQQNSLPKGILIAIVGPCGAGKTTLAKGLISHGFNARAIVQEHSFVPTMWKRFTNPDILIFLQASHSIGALRRKMDWSEDEWLEQQRRLADARMNADYYLDTDKMTIEAVLEAVLNYLQS